MLVTQEIFEAFLKCHTKSHLISRGVAIEDTAPTPSLERLEEVYRRDASITLRAGMAERELYIGTPPVRAAAPRADGIRAFQLGQIDALPTYGVRVHHKSAAPAMKTISANRLPGGVAELRPNFRVADSVRGDEGALRELCPVCPHVSH